MGGLGIFFWKKLKYFFWTFFYRFFYRAFFLLQTSFRKNQAAMLL